MAEQHGVAGTAVPGARAGQRTAGLSRQIQSAGLTDAEFLQEFIAFLAGILVGSHDHADVRGLLQNAGERPIGRSMLVRILVCLTVHGDGARHAELVGHLVQAKL